MYMSVFEYLLCMPPNLTVFTSAVILPTRGNGSDSNTKCDFSSMIDRVTASNFLFPTTYNYLGEPPRSSVENEDGAMPKPGFPWLPLSSRL